jgi:hypothetical protein
LLLTGAIAAMTACPLPAWAKGSLLVVVTRAEPQVQAMAMILTQQALERHTEVRLLLCGPAGDLALNVYTGPTLQSSGRTAQQMLKGVIQGGAKVEICQLYIVNSGGKTAADLIEGVTVTTAPVIGEYMDQPDVRYFTF